LKARISYPDARSFQNLLDALAKIVDEVSMKITRDGVRIVALDPAHVALIDVNLPPDTFLEYDVPDEEVRAGVNLSTVLKIVKRGKKGDKLEIVVEEDKVRWSIEGATIKRYTLLNLDVPEPEVPEASLEFNARISMIVDPLRNALRDAEVVGDTVEFEAPDDTVFIIRGVGAARTETKIPSDSPAVVEYEVKEASKSQYSIDYLKNILSLTKVADTVVLEFSSDMPLRLQFKLPAGGEVTYLLAPKAV